MNLQIEDVQKHGDKLVSLLKEYTKKMERLTDSVDRIRSEWLASYQKNGPTDSRFKRQRLEGLTRQIDQMRDRSFRLAQHVSQFIRFGGLSETMRVELEIRLADFEAAIDAASVVAHASSDTDPHDV